MENCRFKLGIVFLCEKKNSKIFACGALKKKGNQTQLSYITHLVFGQKITPEWGGRKFWGWKVFRYRKKYKKTLNLTNISVVFCSRKCIFFWRRLRRAIFLPSFEISRVFKARVLTNLKSHTNHIYGLQNRFINTSPLRQVLLAPGPSTYGFDFGVVVGAYIPQMEHSIGITNGI